MLYLLDANVLIDAHRDYYPLERVPEFWDWLLDRAATQQVKIPLEMYEEILVGKEEVVKERLASAHGIDFGDLMWPEERPNSAAGDADHLDGLGDTLHERTARGAGSWRWWHVTQGLARERCLGGRPGAVDG